MRWVTQYTCLMACGSDFKICESMSSFGKVMPLSFLAVVSSTLVNWRGFLIIIIRSDCEPAHLWYTLHLKTDVVVTTVQWFRLSEFLLSSPKAYLHFCSIYIHIYIYVYIFVLHIKLHLMSPYPGYICEVRTIKKWKSLQRCVRVWL